MFEFGSDSETALFIVFWIFVIIGLPILFVIFIGYPIMVHHEKYCESLKNNLTKIKDSKEFMLEHDKYYPICIL